MGSHALHASPYETETIVIFSTSLSAIASARPVVELCHARRGAQEIGGDPILCASWPGSFKANLAQREKYGKSQPRWA
jgi:hypothetical protein